MNFDRGDSNQELNNLEAHDLVDSRMVCRALKTSPRNLSRWIKSGRVPKPFKVGQQNRWFAGDIRKWIAAECPANIDWMKVKAI